MFFQQTRHSCSSRLSKRLRWTAYHDILVAQRGYGDALEKSNGGLGNDTADNATDFRIAGVQQYSENWRQREELFHQRIND